MSKIRVAIIYYTSGTGNYIFLRLDPEDVEAEMRSCGGVVHWSQEYKRDDVSSYNAAVGEAKAWADDEGIEVRGLTDR